MTNTLVTFDEFKTLANKKRIFSYATNLEGIGFIKLFSQSGLDVGGFIDSRQFKNGEKRGFKVINPTVFFAENKPEDVIVIVTAKHRQTRKSAIEQCKEFGLVQGKSLFVTSDLCDYMPTIEISGICNLRCISCIMGIPGANKNSGLMTAETYRKILTKMRQEIPFLNSVYLYLWGEPLLNPELPEIIRITNELGVACEISTNLCNAKNLEKVIAAQPEILVIPTSGVGDNFELTRTGGKWNVFKKNLYDLRAMLDKYNAETVVRMHYHLYKHNMGQDYTEMEALANELGFLFVPILAQIFPDYVVKSEIYGKPIPEKMLRASEMLHFPIAEQLENARRNKTKNCFMIKAFPVVRWNTSVIQCCNLSFPSVSTSYLDNSFETLLQAREDNKFCDVCVEHGLHRYFDVDTSVQTVEGKRILVRNGDTA